MTTADPKKKKKKRKKKESLEHKRNRIPVSYTHIDVYKRQPDHTAATLS